MLIEKLKASRTRLNVLAKCDVMASYDFFTTIVSFDSLSSEDFEKIIKNRESVQECYLKKEPLKFEAYEALSKTQSLIAHEYTHFYDCTSTVWGARYLDMMSNATRSRIW